MMKNSYRLKYNVKIVYLGARHTVQTQRKIKSRVSRITWLKKLICDTNEYRKHQKNIFTVKFTV